MVMGLLSSRFGMNVRARVVAGVAAGLLTLASPAMGQFRGAQGRMSEPDVTSEQLTRIDEMLALSENQQLVVDELHAAYLAEVTALGEEVSKVSDAARNEFRESRDPGVWRDLGDVMEKFQVKKKDLTDGFLSDMRLVLTAEQDSKWAEVERYHRRSSTMGNDGLISGESVDLVEAVRTLDLPAEAEQRVDPLLDQYEVEVDRALIERNKAYEQGLAQGRTLFFERNFDEMEKLYDKSRDAAVKVRDVNQRYARQVLNTLDSEEAAKLQKEIDTRSFPQVYRESYAQKAFDAAAGIEGLNAEQKKQVADLRAAFDRDMDAANRKLADAIAESEMTRTVRSMFGRGPGGPGRGGNDESDAVKAAREARQDLSSRMLDRLRETLGPDLSSKLPAREGVENWRERALAPQ